MPSAKLEAAPCTALCPSTLAASAELVPSLLLSTSCTGGVAIAVSGSAMSEPAVLAVAAITVIGSADVGMLLSVTGGRVLSKLHSPICTLHASVASEESALAAAAQCPSWSAWACNSRPPLVSEPRKLLGVISGRSASVTCKSASGVELASSLSGLPVGMISGHPSSINAASNAVGRGSLCASASKPPVAKSTCDMTVESWTSVASSEHCASARACDCGCSVASASESRSIDVSRCSASKASTFNSVSSAASAFECHLGDHNSSSSTAPVSTASTGAVASA
mmetsp:Transcript_137091/g.249241  ORF Transcript_137091/g.249241 Transcript_137091/m.249241 type:complete len:281 (+) Transcript_137091:457-1299(+)